MVGTGAPKKDKVPVLPSSLPNESALVTDSEDDSDTNDTFHDAETTLLPANSVIISTANAAIKVLQFVSISQPSLYHL